ncbi:MAG: hypothetical protein OXH28_03165, partial [bacterium]|nr:hypothetical protein [bacterium]
MLGVPGVRQDLPLVQLLGPWIRNDSYSEHPGRKIDGLGLSEGDLSTMRRLGQALAESNATLMIRILERDVVLHDSRGVTLTLPHNGRRRRLGGGLSGRVLEAGETLTIEMVASDGRQVDTFFREGEWLVRWTDIEPRGLPLLEVDTVYERPPFDPDALSADP